MYTDKTDGDEKKNRRTLNSYLQGGCFSLKHKRQTWKEIPGLPTAKETRSLSGFYVR